MRILEDRRDPDVFEVIRRRLASVKGFSRVRVNSNTGSVVLFHPESPFDEIATELRQPDLYEFVAGPEPATSALDRFQTGVAKINQVISRGTSGIVDLKTVAVILLVALAIRQLRRGSLIGPAFPLLWSALDIALRLHKEPQPAADAENQSTPNS